MSKRNYARVVILKGRFSKEMPVREIITEKVMFVGLEDIIEERMALIVKCVCGIKPSSKGIG